MPTLDPRNAKEVRRIVEKRLAVAERLKGAQESIPIEWRGQPRSIPVISMPVDLLYYNPDTHRIRAQRSMDSALESKLEANPYGAPAQGYLHQLLQGDPKDPSKVDPAFIALKKDLRKHGQNEAGIMTRTGVLINGNTRRAALKEIGEDHIRVGILPPDAGHEDIRAIELALQLRKDYKRDYSFMNFLLAVDEHATAGGPVTNILERFRIKQATYEQCRWILAFVKEAIERSQVKGPNNETLSLRLIHFEAHQGRLEELYRTYCTLKKNSPQQAEALREQRLLALVLDKSKTDLRLIEPDFAQKYMKSVLPVPVAAAPRKIPGTKIQVPPPSPEVLALKQLATQALQAQAVKRSGGAVPTAEVDKASQLLKKLDESVSRALDLAGKQTRIIKRRLAAAERISDACDDLELATASVAEAKGSNAFDRDGFDEALVTLKENLEKLAAVVLRGSKRSGEGMAWLRSVAAFSNGAG